MEPRTPAERLDLYLRLQALEMRMDAADRRMDGIEKSLDERAGRIERFLLGGLIFIALAVATPLVALVIRSGGTI